MQDAISYVWSQLDLNLYILYETVYFYILLGPALLYLWFSFHSSFIEEKEPWMTIIRVLQHGSGYSYFYAVETFLKMLWDFIKTVCGYAWLLLTLALICLWFNTFWNIFDNESFGRSFTFGEFVVIKIVLPILFLLISNALYRWLNIILAWIPKKISEMIDLLYYRYRKSNFK